MQGKTTLNNSETITEPCGWSVRRTRGGRAVRSPVAMPNARLNPPQARHAPVERVAQQAHDPIVDLAHGRVGGRLAHGLPEAHVAEDRDLADGPSPRLRRGPRARPRSRSRFFRPSVSEHEYENEDE